MLNIDQVFQQALAHHQANQLPEAEHLYLAILQIQPQHSETNHNLGAIAIQKKTPAAALPYFMSALNANPAHGQYWLSYIDALIQANQLNDAHEVLSIAQQQGLEGPEVDAMALRLNQCAQPSSNLGTTSNRANPEPASYAATSLPVKKNTQTKSAKSNKAPNQKELNALLALFNKGQYPEAIRLAQDMTLLYPSYGFGWKALGTLLKQTGRNVDALVAMQKAVALLPKDHEAHNNLGITLQVLGRLNEAAQSYKLALKLKPKYADALGNLGAALHDLGRLQEAEASYRQALKISPDNVVLLSNLGNSLKDLNRLNEAEASYRLAIKHHPDYADAHYNLGAILHDSGRIKEAEASYQRTLQINPNNAAAFSNFLFCRTQNISVDAATLFAEHCQFGIQFETPLKKFWPQHLNAPIAERKLKIGFVSGDFRNHAVAFFIEPVLAHLSGHPELSFHAYYNHVINDSITQRLQQHFTQWNQVFGLSEDELAEKVRSDGIDILIDLSGHTDKNRLLTFARKPAPIQASWIGYPGTTGLLAMDYFLADRFFLPHGQFDSQFTEKIANLPAGTSFLPSKNSPSVNALPALNNGYLTFGSFNRLSKLSPSIIAVWSQLLKAVPDAQLLLGAMPVCGYERLHEWFSQEGIAPERLQFHRRCDIDNYLKLHHQVDICLDTFPYNGGTTTHHALWMGVPTLSMAGLTPAGRSGASILSHVNLGEFIATDTADYVQKGVFWANHLELLSQIRVGLRENLTKSDIGNPAVAAAGLEHVLRSMWQRWCSNLPPVSF